MQIPRVMLNGGEVSEEVASLALVNERVRMGLRTCLNFIPIRSGGAYKRTGFKHCATSTLDYLLTTPRFILRTLTIGSDSYLVEIGEGYIKLYDHEGNRIVRGPDESVSTSMLADWVGVPIITNDGGLVYRLDPITSPPSGNSNYPYVIYVNGTVMSYFSTDVKFAPASMLADTWTIATHADGVRLTNPTIYLNSTVVGTAVLDYRTSLFTPYTEEHLRELDDDDAAFTKLIAHEVYPLGALIRTSESGEDWFYGQVDYNVASEDPYARPSNLQLVTTPPNASENQTLYEYAVAAVDEEGREGPPIIFSAGLGPNVPGPDEPGTQFEWYGRSDNEGEDIYPTGHRHQWRLLPSATDDTARCKWISLSNLGVTGTDAGRHWMLVDIESANSWAPTSVYAGPDFADQMYLPTLPDDLPSAAPFRGEVEGVTAAATPYTTSNRFYPTPNDNDSADVGRFLWCDVHLYLKEHAFTDPNLASIDSAPMSGDTLFIHLPAGVDPNTLDIVLDFEPVREWKVYRRTSRTQKEGFSTRVITATAQKSKAQRAFERAFDPNWTRTQNTAKIDSLATVTRGQWTLLHAFRAFGGVRNSTLSSVARYMFEDKAEDYTPIYGYGPVLPPTEILVKPGQYPHRVLVLGDRLVLGRSEDEDQTFWIGRQGDLFDFGEAAYLDALRPFDRRIDGNSPIEYMVGEEDMILFTSQRTFRFWAPDGIVQESTVALRGNGQFGCLKNVKPVQVEQAFVFANKSGDEMFVMTYDDRRKAYIGQSLTDLAPHIFDHMVPIEGAYTGNPNRLIWWVTSDLQEFPVLLLSAEDQLWSWARCRVHYEDEIFTVASVPQPDGPDKLFAGIRRYVNPSGPTALHHTIESLSEYNDDPEMERYLDGYVEVGQAPSLITAVSWNGVEVSLTVPDIPKTVAATIDKVHILDLTVVSPTDGSVLLRLKDFNCYARGTPSSGQWRLFSDAAGLVPITSLGGAYSITNDINDYFAGTYTYPAWKAGDVVETVTGIEHLEGLAIGVVVNGRHAYLSNGGATGSLDISGLEKWAVHAYVGRWYPTELETYDLCDITDSSQLYGTIKSPTSVKIGVSDTPFLDVAMSGGSLSRHAVDVTDPIVNRSENERLDQVVAKPGSRPSPRVTVRIRQDQPFGAKLHSITPSFESEE